MMKRTNLRTFFWRRPAIFPEESHVVWRFREDGKNRMRPCSYGVPTFDKISRGQVNMYLGWNLTGKATKWWRSNLVLTAGLENVSHKRLLAKSRRWEQDRAGLSNQRMKAEALTWHCSLTGWLFPPSGQSSRKSQDAFWNQMEIWKTPIPAFLAWLA